jgi:hypothetical protein
MSRQLAGPAARATAPYVIAVAGPNRYRDSDPSSIQAADDPMHPEEAGMGGGGHVAVARNHATSGAISLSGFRLTKMTQFSHAAV